MGVRRTKFTLRGLTADNSLYILGRGEPSRGSVTGKGRIKLSKGKLSKGILKPS